MTRKKSDPLSPYYAWLSKHGRKRTYSSHARAWLAIARICLQDRELCLLYPYDCTWTDDWRDGPIAAPHVHVGHYRRHRWRKSRARRLLYRYAVWSARRYVIWPYYRARRRRRLRQRGR